MKPYWNKSYEATVTDGGVDVLTVKKHSGCDQASITMVINKDVKRIEIDIRSKDQMEQLHFLLGQLINTK